MNRIEEVHDSMLGVLSKQRIDKLRPGPRSAQLRGNILAFVYEYNDEEICCIYGVHILL